MVQFTVFTSQTGSLSKVIFQNADGGIDKKPNAMLYHGTAKTLKTEFSELYRLLLAANDPAAPTNIALSQGICGRHEVEIVSERLIPEYPSAITRSKENFYFPEASGVALLDHDPSRDGPTYSRGDVLRLLAMVIPGFDAGEKIVASSTSAGIYRFGNVSDCDFHSVEVDGPDVGLVRRRVQKPAIRSDGLHIYLSVQNASDLPRFGKVVTKRLWLAGYGRVEISASGALLERTLVDAAVFSPERLDFISRPELGDGLVQYRPDPEYFSGVMLDTTQTKDLTPAEEARYAEMVADAKEARREEAEAVKAQRIAQDASRLSAKRGIPLSKAKEVVAAALSERQELMGDFMLHFRWLDDWAVADVLRDPTRFHGEELLDPVEPEYKSGYCAKLFANDNGSIIVHSMAHGGRTFKLVRTPVKLLAGELHKTVADMEALFKAETTPHLFQRGGELARIVRQDKNTTAHGIKRLAGSAQIQVVNDVILGLMLSPLSVALKWKDGKGKDSKGSWVRTDWSDKVLKVYAACGEWDLPSLVGIVEAPTLTPSGEVVDVEGYDPKTGLFLDYGGYEFPRPPLNPGREEAMHALNVLKDWLGTFPFATEVDKSVAVAASATGVIRRILPTSPIFLFDATTPGSGKALLADGIGILVSGREPTTVSYTVDEAENRKRWMSLLKESQACVLIDNIDTSTEFKGDTLCTITTKESFSDRQLSVNKTITAPTNTLILASGNNVLVRGDLSRRVMRCRLDPRCERPEERQFPRDFRAFTREHRGKLVVALLTILRAHHLAGRPDRERHLVVSRSGAGGLQLRWSGWVWPIRLMP